MEIKMNSINDLTGVRQSHRYVAAYQRRLLDAISNFNNRLINIGFKFEEWGSLHFDRPPKKSNPAILTNYWAYDFIHLYSVGFYWTKGEENKKNFVYFGLEHLADSGLENALDFSNEEEPDPLKFKDAAEADSILRCFWLLIATENSPFSNTVWNNTEYEDLIKMHFNKDIMNDFSKLYEPLLPFKEEHKDGVLFGQMAISIENIPTMESFENDFCNIIIDRLSELSPPDENEE